jgi:flagellar hook-associated protein 2
MSGIASGVGLISGLDYQSLVDQLIAIEARPRDSVLQRIGTIDAQRTAYLGISARITALLSRLSTLSQPASFRATTANAAPPDVIDVSTGTAIQPGTYNFMVRGLATTHSLISRGFHERSAQLSSGSMTIESALARVDRGTSLDTLNGHTGVRRGQLKISNGDLEETISLVDALTVGDVLDRINAADVGVQASIDGDHIVLDDTTGGGNVIRVQEISGGHVAEDLGFGVGNNAGTGSLSGGDVVYIADTTVLRALNDGVGVRRSLGGSDFELQNGDVSFDVDLSGIIKHNTRLDQLNHGQGVRLGTVRVTTRDGSFAEIDLSQTRTIGEVQNALQDAFDNNRISVVLSSGHLSVTDNTDIDGLSDDQIEEFQIEDVSGYAAHDLGIAGTTAENRITGDDVLHMSTMADVIAAVNFAVGNEDDNKDPVVTASIANDGNGIALNTFSGPLVIKTTGATSAGTLQDLGLTAGTYFDPGNGAEASGSRIIGGLNTVLLRTLNGGSGIEGGTIHIDANGAAADVDLSGAETLSDVVRLMTAAAETHNLGIEVGYDSTGTRLNVTNIAGGGNITISDVDGTFAADAGLDQSGAAIRGANLQRRYMSESTLLSELNNGLGIAGGAIEITDSSGATAVVNLSGSHIETLGDVIDEINAASVGVQARINDTGDGILLIDQAAGSGTISVAEDGGTTARDLNLLGAATDGQIDGSFEFTLEIGGSDTLESLVTRIGAETTLASAALINDGTGVAPYRLNITSRASGAGGALIIDDSLTNLGMSTLTTAQDARLLYGGSADSGVLITSSDNTFENVIDGLTITAQQVSDTPVSVTVDRDLDQLVATMKGLVTDFNSAMDAIAEAGDYDEETETLGVLQGEGTLRNVENRLYRHFTKQQWYTGSLKRLSEIGIEPSTGARLAFDEDKFRAAYEADPEAVTRFFTDETSGVATTLEEEIKKITEADGMIDRRTATLQDRKELFEDRVDTLNERLARKRERLLRQFQAMEVALAELQSQSAALTDLSSLYNNFGSSTMPLS